MTRAWAFSLVLAAGAIPATSAAQSPPPERTPPRSATVPSKQLPPRGMCRIWVANVPAARQPAPTDCASAVRNRPPNARVIFPEERPAPRPALRPSPARTARPAAKDTTARRKPPATKPPA